MNISLDVAARIFLVAKAEEINMKPMKMSLCCKLCAKREYFSAIQMPLKYDIVRLSERFFVLTRSVFNLFLLLPSHADSPPPPSIVVYKIQ